MPDNFTLDFEYAVLACFISVPDEFNRASIRQYAEAFRKCEHIEITFRLDDFLAKHEDPPTWAGLQEIVVNKFSRQGRSEDEINETLACFTRLRTVDVKKELPVVKEKLEEWRAEKILEKAVNQWLEAKTSGIENDRVDAQKALALAVTGVDTANGKNYLLRSAFDFIDLEIPANTCLLGDDFLCRGDGALYIGPTSGGKSTSSLLQDIYWACGREAFGIAPNGPLKSLHIQAEDNDKKMKQRVEDIVRAVDRGPKPFTDAELELIDQNTVIIRCNDLTGEKFLGQLRQWLRETEPDIVRINPVFSYLGGDASDAKIVTAFLRTGLNPLLSKFNCAGILVHHPPKPRREGQEIKISDYAYAGFGSSEFANWARAILAFEATTVYGLWHFVACKPGPSLSWKDEFGRPTVENYFAWDNGTWRHSTEDDLRELQERESAAKKGHSRGRKPKYPNDSLLSLLCGSSFTFEGYRTEVANSGCKIPKTTLWDRWQKWITDGLLTEVGENNGDKMYTRASVRKSNTELEVTEPARNDYEH